MNYTPAIDLLKEARGGPQRDFNEDYLSPSNTMHRHKPTKSSPLKNETGSLGSSMLQSKTIRSSPLKKPKQFYNTTTTTNTNDNTNINQEETKSQRKIKELQDELARLKKDTRSTIIFKDQQLHNLTEWADKVKEKLTKYHTLYQDSKKEIEQLKQTVEALKRGSGGVNEDISAPKEKDLNAVKYDDMVKLIEKMIAEKLNNSEDKEIISPPPLTATATAAATAPSVAAETEPFIPISQTPVQNPDQSISSLTKSELNDTLRSTVQDIMKEIFQGTKEFKLKQFNGNSATAQDEDVGNDTAQMLQEDTQSFTPPAGHQPQKQSQQTQKSRSFISNEVQMATQKWEALHELKTPIEKLDQIFDLKQQHISEQYEYAQRMMRIGKRLTDELESYHPYAEHEEQKQQDTESHDTQTNGTSSKKKHVTDDTLCKCEQCSKVSNNNVNLADDMNMDLTLSTKDVFQYLESLKDETKG
ncbi:hypothetical protein WICPIJ_000672 [Wickerhamomyces pijperi]|uniref:Uncharacterized protein n=1 Tax=Wickerhamomyces pijperi TaxID=599730 RepID=A0A9P8QFX3_WICPI|nr:hypothetical protein WICPIJ_000672 [Wickerhamomyces pijperi]